MPKTLSATPIYDIAIVGFGPAGAVAAGLLGGQGLSVFVCDKSQDVYELPRAFALDHEIMRVFQQLGIEDEVLAFTEPFTPSEFFGVDGKLIKRFTTVEPPYPLGYVPSLVFTQPPVERVLRAHVQNLANVTVALGCEFTGLVQDQDSVTLTVTRSVIGNVNVNVNVSGDGDGLNHDARPTKVRARYVIACDGATSPVRNAVGMELQDLGFDQAWLVVDVLVNDQGLTKLPQTSVQYCEPSRPCTFLIGPKNHRRWEISINPGEDPKALATPQGTWKLLSRWITPEDGTLWRQASYRFHALVAKHWREGRVFVAGDAAHQQPPFLGQGMCQGIRDVANLSWKLGAVLRGEATEDLLESYGVERKAHVTELTQRIKVIGQLIGERNTTMARARDAQLLSQCHGLVKSVPRQDVQPALQQGILSPQPHPARGTLFPQPWVVQGTARTRLDDVAGTGWRLVVRGVEGQPAFLQRSDGSADLLHPLHLRHIALSNTPQLGALYETDCVMAQWFEKHQCVAALVRPDHYVFGVAASTTDIDDLVRSAERQVTQAEHAAKGIPEKLASLIGDTV